MARHRYTDEERGFILATLNANGGNAKRTARETGFPLQTIRDLRARIEKQGASKEIVVATEDATNQFIGDAERIRNKALALIENKIDNEPDKIKVNELNNVMGTLEDKIRLIRGQPTSRVENVGTATDPAQLGAAMMDFVSGAIQAARERTANIEAVESKPVLELPAADTE